jgi:nucleotide-binding universal stress UspA family protein
MFRNALIGIDEDEEGRDQAWLARWLCAPDANLTLARVHRGDSDGAKSGLNPGQDAQARMAEAALQRAARVTGVTAMASVGARSTGDGLARLVDEAGADLLAVGSPGGDAGTIEFADWLARILTQIACPIAVAPVGFRTALRGSQRNIGVVLDDAEESWRALVCGRRIADAQGAELEVVVLPTIAAGDQRNVGAQITQDLFAFAAGVDLLVVGPRGAGPLGRLGHPGATLALLRGIELPLLLVPQPTGLAEGGGYLSEPAGGRRGEPASASTRPRS